MKIIKDVEIVGFEGDVCSKISWGTAAVKIDNTLLNPTTGLSCWFSNFADLVEKNCLCSIFPPIKIKPQFINESIIVLYVKNDSLLKIYNCILEKKSITSEERYDGTFYVFRSLNVLKQISKIITKDICDEFFKTGQCNLINETLILNHSNPNLNALKVLISKNDDLVKRICEANIRSDKDLKAFNRFINKNKDFKVPEFKISEGLGFKIAEGACISKPTIEDKIKISQLGFKAEYDHEARSYIIRKKY